MRLLQKIIPRHLCFKGQASLQHTELILGKGNLPLCLKSSGNSNRTTVPDSSRSCFQTQYAPKIFFPAPSTPTSKLLRPNQPPSFTCLNLKSKSQAGRGIVTSNCNIPQEFVWELKGAKPGPSPKLASLSFLQTTFDLLQCVECKCLSYACLAALEDPAGLLWPTVMTGVSSLGSGEVPTMSYRPPKLAFWAMF